MSGGASAGKDESDPRALNQQAGSQLYARLKTGRVMTNSREDLSKWALHFVHDHNWDSVPTDDELPFEDYEGFPYHECKERNDRFDTWRISDERYQIDPDADALQVVLKIVTDGHIRASWAFRNRRPTIYGPRSAVCFTEMPLYALLDYAHQRKDSAVTPYAIGLYKRELFRAGARPVIYGLTGNHLEQRTSDPIGPWPRKLDPSCGIAESEQYRYVAMSSDPLRPIDWSHEREWRWADHQDQYSCPGIPIWLSDEGSLFTRALIIVQNLSDMERVLDRLKELHDAGSNDSLQSFSREMLQATAVVALDRLEKSLGNIREQHLRLEDISPSYIQGFDQPEASPEWIMSVRSVLEEARVAANNAAAEHRRKAPKAKSGGSIADVAGWAHLYLYGGQTPLVSALLRLGEIRSHPGTGYYFRSIGGLGWDGDQALSLAEAAVRGGMAVFEKHFPDASFGIETRWD